MKKILMSVLMIGMILFVSCGNNTKDVTTQDSIVVVDTVNVPVIDTVVK